MFSWWKYAINVTQDLLWYEKADRMLSCERRERDALLTAIEKTKQLSQGDKRIDVIAFIYWNGKKHTIEEAADHVGIPKLTAKKWHVEFIRMVGECLGFDTSNPPKKRGPRPKKIRTPGRNGDRGEV